MSVFHMIVVLFRSFVRTQADLAAVNLALRQQLAVLDHSAAMRWFKLSCYRRVSIQGKMRSCLVIIIKIRRQDALEMFLVEDNDVIQTLSPD